jgi:hypothetical protein
VKRIHRSWRLLLPLLLAGLIALTSGCLTKQAVEDIVVRTNASMVSPYLTRPGEPESANPDQVLADLDRLVQAHPDNPVLVNHLRLRQAMVLTVHRRTSLAEERWNQVSSSELKSERDRALYASRNVLVWAYHRLPIADGFEDEERTQAKRSLRTLDEALEPVKTRDIMIYLRTVRVQIALKLANSMDEEREKQAIEELMASALNQYAGSFTTEDRSWAKQNFTKPSTPVEMSLNEFRQRIWLRDLIQIYVSEAKSRDLSPAWGSEVRAVLPDSTGSRFFGKHALAALGGFEGTGGATAGARLGCASNRSSGLGRDWSSPPPPRSSTTVRTRGARIQPSPIPT